ncbi:MAG TPA: DUF1592 domain-containing protein [Polyangiaceae bacterium]
MTLRSFHAVPALVATLAALACSSAGGGADGDGDGDSGGNGNGGTAGSSAGSSGSSNGGSGTGGASGSSGNAGVGNVGGGVDLPPGTTPPSLLPAGVRRLTNAEFEASVRALLGAALPSGTIFPPDARQDGFTRNDAQRVDPVFAKQVAAAAAALGEGAKPRAGELAPCADTPGTEACARTFIESFGAKAYRRQLTTEEVDGLVAVYRVGADGATYADGIGLVIEALLQSAGFLYETEIGDGTVLDPIMLAPHELASSLSFLVVGQPPDAELLQAAADGALATPEGREAQAWRLMGTGDPARFTMLRIVREWLGIDRIAETAKDSNVYETFETLRPHMAAEVDAFVNEVISGSTGTVGELLGADWTIASPALASGFYGLAGGGSERLSLAGTGRRGILNQPAFLSVYAHASESAPVFRGVAVMRRLACADPGSPTDLNIDVVPPPPDPNLTTRDRFGQHVADDRCAGCHASIDGIGFTFENFDGMGASRGGMENGHPVNTQTTVELGLDFDGPYANSDELALAMSRSAAVRACFAEHLFNAMSATSVVAVKPSRESYVSAWRTDANAEAGNIASSILAYIRSPIFAYRRAQ